MSGLASEEKVEVGKVGSTCLVVNLGQVYILWYMLRPNCSTCQTCDFICAAKQRHKKLQDIKL